MPCATEGVLGHLGENLKQNVGNDERWLSMFGAGALVTAGLMRGSPLLLIAGAGLAFRGATGHCALYEATGVNTNKIEAEPRSRIAF